MKPGLAPLVLAASCASASLVPTAADVAARAAAQSACVAENDAVAPARTCYLAVQAEFCGRYPSDPTCLDGGQ